MRVSKAWAAGGVALAVVTAGLLGAPTAAEAAYVCPDGKVCLYEDHNATGSVAVEPRLNFETGYDQINNLANSHYTNGDSANNSISSLVNDTGFGLTLCTDINLGGICYTFSSQAHLVQDIQGLLNDTASSAFD